MPNTHVVAETTNLKAIHYAQRIWDGISAEDIDNGTFGYLDGQNAGYEGGVIYDFVKGTNAGSPVVMAHMPEWSYDTNCKLNQRKDKFYNEAGVPFRCFTLTVGDEVSLSESGFIGTPEVGKYVSIADSGKLTVADTAPTDAVLVGKIMRKRQIGSTLVTDLRTYGYERMMYTVKVESLA